MGNNNETVLNNNIRELQKEEAIYRLNKIGVMEQVVRAFKAGDVMCSERNSMFPAALFEINEELQKKIAEYEAEYNCYVYHIQLTHTEFGNMYSFLYVSANQDEWNDDRQDLTEGLTYALLWNNEVEEIGLIGIKTMMGGIVRTF